MRDADGCEAQLCARHPSPCLSSVRPSSFVARSFRELLADRLPLSRLAGAASDPHCASPSSGQPGMFGRDEFQQLAPVVDGFSLMTYDFSNPSRSVVATNHSFLAWLPHESEVLIR